MNGDPTIAPAALPRLWWSRDGLLRCTRHLPQLGSPAWLGGGWEVVSADARARLSGALAAPARCGSCCPEAGP